jgi:hypothetical protein
VTEDTGIPIRCPRCETGWFSPSYAQLSADHNARCPCCLRIWNIMDVYVRIGDLMRPTSGTLYLLLRDWKEAEGREAEE